MKTKGYPQIGAGLADVAVHPSAEALPKQEGFYPTFGKRLFDIFFSSVMLVMFAPLIGILLFVVSLDGSSPLFRHNRIGQGGRVFGCLKIRSMVADAPERLAEVLARDPEAAAEWAASHKLTNDPRITQFGQFLRKSSLDELPQLWQVLRGEMSIVGPRPIVREEMVRYGTEISSYLQMRPGLTGPWQATGRNELSYDERVALDVDYAHSMSFGKDLVIIAMTAMAVLRRTGK